MCFGLHNTSTPGTRNRGLFLYSDPCYRSSAAIPEGRLRLWLTNVSATPLLRGIFFCLFDRKYLTYPANQSILRSVLRTTAICIWTELSREILSKLCPALSDSAYSTLKESVYLVEPFNLSSVALGNCAFIVISGRHRPPCAHYMPFPTFTQFR